MKAKTILILAGFFGLTAVALGAFAAHSLSQILSPDDIRIFQTGVQYQMYHALALFGVGILALQRSDFETQGASLSFLLGIIIFSGSLYALTLTGVRILGAITPIGGLAFLLGWGLLIRSAWKI